METHQFVEGQFHAPGTIMHGRPCFELHFSHLDKVMELGYDHPTIRKTDGLYNLVDDPEDPWSTYKILKFYIENHLANGYRGKLFLRVAGAQQLRKRREVHVTYTADDQIINRRDGPGPRGKIGHNYVNQLFKELAGRCGFEVPERFTGRAAKRTGITNAKCKFFCGLLLFIFF